MEWNFFVANEEGVVFLVERPRILNNMQNFAELTLKVEGAGAECKMSIDEVLRKYDDETVVWYFYEEGIKQCLLDNNYKIA